MKAINLSGKWADDNTVISDIYCVSNQIGTRLNRDVPMKDALTLEKNIKEVLLFWTESTYIGKRKEQKLQKAYQQFFENLIKFSWRKKISKNLELSECGLYQGPMYRVLGNGYEHINIRKYIEPEYDGIFVSWSKSENIPTPYMKQKLYGPITKIKSIADGINYAIDLEFWGVSNSNEREVVFPTTRLAVENIKYLPYEIDE